MKARILLIEDSPQQAKEITCMLRNRGYEAFWADGGIKGLKMAREVRPDLMLLDVVMSDMDGYTVCRWLKLNEVTKDIPIIMLTVKGEVSDKVEGLEVGANDYLPKPFNEQELEARIYAALRTRSLQNELKGRNKELQKLLHKVEFMAITDPLTGLYNRRRFYDALKKEFATTKRYQYPLSCIMIDIDYFKQINDRYGHAAGDVVLKELGHILSASLREVDIVSRFGGEEFAILLPYTPKDNVLVVANRLMDKVRDADFKYEGSLLKVTISMGIASIEDIKDIKGVTEEDLIRYADDALYRAKETGRNKIVVFGDY